MVLVVRFKQDYYMDELLSFSLSNNETGWIRIIDGNIYNPEQLYHDELMPAPEHRFDYEMVWHNQTTDVHPPLYYALLHTACSMMPNKVSKWMPAAINFLFALMTLYVMHRLFCVFVETEAAQKGYRRYAGIASLLFTVLPGTLNNVSFFRMYVMAMLLVAVIAYISVIVVRTGYIQIGGGQTPALACVAGCGDPVLADTLLHCHVSRVRDRRPDFDPVVQ